MASVGDRVKEATSTTGTGTLNLGGVVDANNVTFVNGIGNGVTDALYILEDANGTDWEVGIGTITSGSPDTLSRSAVIASSNSGSLISLSAGTHTVFSGLISSVIKRAVDLYNASLASGSILAYDGTDIVGVGIGTNDQVLTADSAQASGVAWKDASGGGATKRFITTATTAVANDLIVADTTSGAFTVTLPASPPLGGVVEFANGADYSVNNLTIGRNGNTIHGAASDFVLDTQYARAALIWDGGDWRLLR